MPVNHGLVEEILTLIKSRPPEDTSPKEHKTLQRQKRVELIHHIHEQEATEDSYLELATAVDLLNKTEDCLSTLQATPDNKWEHLPAALESLQLVLIAQTNEWSRSEDMACTTPLFINLEKLKALMPSDPPTESETTMEAVIAISKAGDAAFGVERQLEYMRREKARKDLIDEYSTDGFSIIWECSRPCKVSGTRERIRLPSSETIEGKIITPGKTILLTPAFEGLVDSDIGRDLFTDLLEAGKSERYRVAPMLETHRTASILHSKVFNADPALTTIQHVIQDAYDTTADVGEKTEALALLKALMKSAVEHENFALINSIKTAALDRDRYREPVSATAEWICSLGESFRQQPTTPVVERVHHTIMKTLWERMDSYLQPDGKKVRLKASTRLFRLLIKLRKDLANTPLVEEYQTALQALEAEFGVERQQRIIKEQRKKTKSRTENIRLVKQMLHDELHEPLISLLATDQGRLVLQDIISKRLDVLEQLLNELGSALVEVDGEDGNPAHLNEPVYFKAFCGNHFSDHALLDGLNCSLQTTSLKFKPKYSIDLIEKLLFIAHTKGLPHLFTAIEPATKTQARLRVIQEVMSRILQLKAVVQTFERKYGLVNTILRDGGNLPTDIITTKTLLTKLEELLGRIQDGRVNPTNKGDLRAFYVEQIADYTLPRHRSNIFNPKRSEQLSSIIHQLKSDFPQQTVSAVSIHQPRSIQLQTISRTGSDERRPGSPSPSNSSGNDDE